MNIVCNIPMSRKRKTLKDLARREILQIVEENPQLDDSNLLPYVARGSTTQYWQNQLEQFRRMRARAQIQQIAPPPDQDPGEIIYIGVNGDVLPAGQLSISFDLVFEEYEDEMGNRVVTINIPPNTDVDDLDDLVNNEVVRYIQDIADEGIDAVNIQAVFNRAAQNVDDEDIARDSNFSKFPYDLECNKRNIETSCFQDMMKRLCELGYPFETIYEISLSKDGWPYDEIIELFKQQKDATIRFYDIRGQETASVVSKGRHKPTLYILMGNNHVDTITKNEVKLLKNNWKCEIMHPINQVRLAKPLNSADVELLLKNHKIIPLKDAHLDTESNDISIVKYIIDKTLYLERFDYDAWKLYKKIGVFKNPLDTLTHKFNALTPLKRLMGETTDVFANKGTPLSVANHYMNRPRPMIVGHIDSKTRRKTKAIDIAKAYSSTCAKLDKVPVVNFKSMCVSYNSAEDIIENDIYRVVKVDDSIKGYVYPGYCTGKRLTHFKDKCIIDKRVSCSLVDNPFKELLTNMLKTDPDTTKGIFNTFYGHMQFQIKNNISRANIPLMFVTGKKEGHRLNAIEMSENLYLVKKEFTFVSRHQPNLLPVAHCIVDTVAQRVMDRIKDMTKSGILVQLNAIQTDAIYYKGSVCKKLRNIPGEWRKESNKGEPKKSNYPLYARNEKCIDRLDTIDQIIEQIYKKKNIIVNDYAGKGKTYLNNTILEKLGKKILEMPLKIVVLCAHNQPLMHYARDLHFDVMSIDSYKYAMTSDNLPFKKYDLIIVDEFGLNNDVHNSFFWTINSHENSFLFVGDIYQLWPVQISKKGEKNPVRTNPNFSQGLWDMFDYEYKLGKNWRNPNLTDERIRKIIEANNESIITDFERVKISTAENPLITNSMICYKNKTRILLNNAMVDKLKWNVKIGKKLIDIGGKFVCRSNHELPKKFKNFGIAKKVIVVVEKFDDETITFTNGAVITHDEFKHFDYGYALTLYGVQGMSIPYEEISFHDTHLYKYFPGAWYTAITRIKVNSNKN